MEENKRQRHMRLCISFTIDMHNGDPPFNEPSRNDSKAEMAFKNYEKSGKVGRIFAGFDF